MYTSSEENKADGRDLQSTIRCMHSGYSHPRALSRLPGAGGVEFVAGEFIAKNVELAAPVVGRGDGGGGVPAGEISCSLMDRWSSADSRAFARPERVFPHTRRRPPSSFASGHGDVREWSFARTVLTHRNATTGPTLSLRAVKVKLALFFATDHTSALQQV